MQMWLKLIKSHPIWYFDATGSIIQDVKGQKMPLLYSIVFHDVKNTKIIPLAEFVTTDHTTISITSNLFYIKKLLQSYSKNELSIFPKFIVVDKSWALINSIVEIFCNMDLLSYLKYCFGILVQNDIERRISYNRLGKPYICSTHF
jgi:hypothetical protein